MKNTTHFYCFILIVSVLALFPLAHMSAQNSAKEKPLSKKEQKWFNDKSWLQGIAALPDTGIDATMFVRHYRKHPKRWQKVFNFIKENDLTALPLGKQSLGEDVTVNIQEYITREPGNEQLEGHKKYIDLQYVVDGRELQGYAKLGTATENVKPYDEKGDIALYKVPVIQYHVIHPDEFTIFFPDNIHMTNIQYGEKTKVRKIVFKVAVE